MNEVIVTPLLAIHLFAGIGALFLGTLQVFFIPRGTKEHKTIGRFWVLVMFFIAITSFYDLANDGLISIPGHIFTALTLILLPLAIWAAKNGKIKMHKICMLAAFYGVLVSALIGLLAAPGRLLNVWFFGG